MAISVVLADDHPVVRVGIKSLLDNEPDLALVGEANDGLEAVRLVEKLHPDILLLDLVMPGLNGMDVLRIVARRVPRTRVIVFSMVTTEASVLEALQQGALGFVPKTRPPTEVVRAIHTVMAGQRFLSPPYSERGLTTKLNRARAADPHDSLTPREREVLQLAAEGNTSMEIARRLSISPRTAEMHRANLMRKLSIRNQTELIRYALRRGIIPMQN